MLTAKGKEKPGDSLEFHQMAEGKQSEAEKRKLKGGTSKTVARHTHRGEYFDSLSTCQKENSSC